MNILEAISPSIFNNISHIMGIPDSFLKYEGFNIAGSIKLKTAKFLVDGLEKRYNLNPHDHAFIESSSGNLGIALSIVCKARNYKFTCVTDPNTLSYSEKYMSLYGAQILKVTERDSSGGFLGKRIELIQSLTKNNQNLIWTNQYASQFNIDAHYSTTAPEIWKNFPDLDFLFVGAGTTGTLVGCAKFFKEFSPKTKIIAVDNMGSVTFGSEPLPRYIPGLGTSRKPEIASLDNIHEIIWVPESETIVVCNQLLKKHGLFLGGSSGTVIYAAQQYIKKLNNKNISLMIISPDFGEKYIDTVYNPFWVEQKFGNDVKRKAFGI